MNHPSQQLLSGLVDKYRRLLRLRTEPTEHPPRLELRKLARDFPGSLRELDRLPLAVIEQRLAALEDVLARAAQPEAWMGLQVSYHGFMRATLRIKRWSRELPDDPAEVLRALAARYVAGADEPELSFFAADVIVVIRRPPQGRLNPFVLDAVARHHGTTVEAVLGALMYAPDDR
jgi:hypothetical protein